MSPKQRDLARHALGLPNVLRRSHRNHFVAGPDHDDYQDWMVLVVRGDAKRRLGNPLTGGDDLFTLTRAGAERALDPGESLDPEDFPS
jgi:hypothetical protein